MHHKIYLTPQNINDPAVTLAEDNLELLCQDCHNKEQDPSKRNMSRICYGPNREILRNPWVPDSPHSAVSGPAQGTEGRG